MSSAISRLPVLIINPHSQCNCRCAMCEIWKHEGGEHITAAQFDSLFFDIEKLGVQWVVFSGGEALLDRDLFRKARRLREIGVRTTLLSSGLLLAKHAEEIVADVNDVIVSLDGPPAVHDAIRGVRRAFELLESGVAEIRRLRTDFRISARCTVQSANCRYLVSTAEAARRIGLDSISFLAVDLHSEAFHRRDGRDGTGLREEDLPGLDAQLAEIGAFGDFVIESQEKLSRIARHFRAHLGLAEFQAPRCNAPWVSAVVEADGRVRPCFFHKPVGRLDGQTLPDVLNGVEALTFRADLRVDQNSICQRCVCSLNWSQPVRN